MRPRKPSTSSGNRPEPLPRPRYLGIEVAGVPLPSPRGVELWLRRLTIPGAAPIPLRVVRVEDRRAIVEVPHTHAAAARAAWNGRLPPSTGPWTEVRTERTWGTLLGAKAWLRSARPAGREPPR